MKTTIALTLLTLLATSSLQADDMADAAKAFLNSLNEEQVKVATFSFTDEERQNWHYFPKQRPGFPLKKMSDLQREAAKTLLMAGLSDAGVAVADAVRMLEGVLYKEEKAAGKKNYARRDPEMYHVTIFGEPGKHPWGWRYEGHHLSINFTSASGTRIGSTPYFVGTNPSIIESGENEGMEVLEKEIQAAQAAYASLSADQKKTALLTETPKEIVTRADRHVTLPEPAGIPLSALSAAQRESVLAVIRQYASHFSSDVAALRLKEINKAGTDGITFAWAGDPDAKNAHYYRIQGPSFIIEYVNVQRNARHAHAVWRDTKTDFGRDYLKDHLDHHE